MEGGQARSSNILALFLMWILVDLFMVVFNKTWEIVVSLHNVQSSPKHKSSVLLHSPVWKGLVVIETLWIDFWHWDRYHMDWSRKPETKSHSGHMWHGPRAGVSVPSDPKQVTRYINETLIESLALGSDTNQWVYVHWGKCEYISK